MIYDTWSVRRRKRVFFFFFSILRVCASFCNCVKRNKSSSVFKRAKQSCAGAPRAPQRTMPTSKCGCLTGDESLPLSRELLTPVWRWLQVDRAGPNCTINAALSSNGGQSAAETPDCHLAVAMLPCFSTGTVEMMIRLRTVQSKQQDKLQFWL